MVARLSIFLFLSTFPLVHLIFPPLSRAPPFQVVGTSDVDEKMTLPDII